MNGITGSPISGTMVIAESDDAESGNIMFTSFMGYDNAKLYATFDVDAGTLTVPTLQAFAMSDGTLIGFANLILSGTSVGIDPSNPAVFKMSQSGSITFGSGTYFGLFTADASTGAINDLTGAYTNFTASKSTSAGTVVQNVQPAKVSAGMVTGTVVRK